MADQEAQDGGQADAHGRQRGVTQEGEQGHRQPGIHQQIGRLLAHAHRFDVVQNGRLRNILLNPKP